MRISGGDGGAEIIGFGDDRAENVDMTGGSVAGRVGVMNLLRFLLLVSCAALLALAVVGRRNRTAPPLGQSVEGAALLARAWDRAHAMPGR